MYSINPEFSELSEPKSFQSHVIDLLNTEINNNNKAVLSQLLNQITRVDFISFADKLNSRDLNNEDSTSELQPASDGSNAIAEKALIVMAIENLLQIAEQNNWGLCKNMDFIYIFNSSFWSYIDKEEFQQFLAQAAERMGIGILRARHFMFREKLMKQFISSANLPTPDAAIDSVSINLLNGTYVVSNSSNDLRPFRKEDFLTYQLPFEFNPDARAPQFQNYLNRVLPDESSQKVLAEYMGYVFLKNGGPLKLEKALLLYGLGANGKSVFFEVINALLGSENISNYSIQSLTDTAGYYRAMIANKLVNYASELNGVLETSIFKTLVSGEIVGARLPYGKPMQIRQYGKLIFNCNELPREVEQSNAYFRRFIIIPFNVTIPESEQDKELHLKIIKTELSGVFNWVLEGLTRLLAQKRFTESAAINAAIEQYKLESDNVKLYIEDKGYKPDQSHYVQIKDLYIDYRIFCNGDGMSPLKKTNFIKRLRILGFLVERINIGNVFYGSF